MFCSETHPVHTDITHPSESIGAPLSELNWTGCQPQEHMALHMNGLFKEHHSQIFLA